MKNLFMRIVLAIGLVGVCLNNQTLEAKREIKNATHVPDTEWTVFLYIEADQWLLNACVKNIYDVTRGFNDQHQNVVIQLHCWANTAWRFIVKDNALIPCDECQLTMQPGQDFQDALAWAFGSFPSKKRMVVLGGHGFGILEPLWHEEANDWVTQFPEDSSQVCPMRTGMHNECRSNCLLPTKGVLLSADDKTFLSNQAMVDAFAHTKKHVLHDKKIDIIGMDCCRMSMLEVGFQLAPYAHCLIGSQDCELKDGWDYYSIMQTFIGESVSLNQLAKKIITSYGEYGQKYAPVGTYTQAALDLSVMKPLAHFLETLNNTLVILSQQHPELFDILRQVRMNMPHFCFMNSYIDICTWLQQLQKALIAQSNHSYHSLIQLLGYGISLTNSAVIANVTGTKSAHAQGISIYFPTQYHPSHYDACDFAQQSAWTDFLKSFFA